MSAMRQASWPSATMVSERAMQTPCSYRAGLNRINGQPVARTRHDRTLQTRRVPLHNRSALTRLLSTVLFARCWDYSDPEVYS